jgi:hypothetical protein
LRPARLALKAGAAEVTVLPVNVSQVVRVGGRVSAILVRGSMGDVDPIGHLQEILNKRTGQA